MRRYLMIIFLSSAMLIFSGGDASAWLVAKLPNMGEDATTAMTKIKEKTQGWLDKAANLTVVKQIGKGFQEAKTWIQEKGSKLKAFSEKVMEQYEVTQKAYNETMKKVNKYAGDYQTIQKDIENIQEEYEAASNELMSVQDNFNQEINAKKSLLEGQKNTLLENIVNLERLMQEDPDNQEKYQQQMDDSKKESQEVDEELSALEAMAAAELESLSAPYEERLDNLKSDLSQLKSDLARVLGISMEEQSDEDALLQTTELYFLQFDEELNPKRQDAIRKNRFRERRDSIVEAYSDALKYIPETVTKDHEAEDLGYNASTFDTTAGSWGADAQLQIDNVKALSSYAHLLVLDLKRMTAIEMAKLTFYKLEKEQKNISEFNLDDYVYEGDK